MINRFLAPFLAAIVALSTFVPLSAQNANVNRQSVTFKLTGGTAAPSSGNCDASAEVNAIYVRYGAPASYPTQVFLCKQTGSSTYAWEPIGYRTGTTAPAKCAVGDIFFDTDATAGQNVYGCTATDTWTLQGDGTGGGGGGGATSLSGLTDLQTTVASTVATTAAGAVDFNGTRTSISAGTITKTAGTDTGTFYIYVDYNGGSPVLKCLRGAGITIGNYTVSSGFSGSTCASGSAFPADSIPLATVDVSSGTLQTPTDYRALFQRDTVSVGTGLSKSGTTVSVDSTVIPDYTGSSKTGKCAQWYDEDTVEAAAAACGTGGSFSVPTRVYTGWVGATEDGSGAGAPVFRITGACGLVARVLPTSTYPETAFTYNNQYCNVFFGGTDGDDGWGPLNGATPVPYSAYVTAGRANAGGDIYIGWVGQKSVTSMNLSGYNDDFVGVRWNSSGSKWQCVVRSGGSDSGTPADLTGGADTSIHRFTIDNNSGASNTARCSIDGGSTVSVTSPTIPTKNAWKFAIGTPSTSTNFSAGFLQFKLN